MRDGVPLSTSLDGQRIGPYRVGAQVGAGGMGTVYRATVEEPVTGVDPGALVALKVVHRHLLTNDAFFKRFLREAKLGRRLRHPNVVATHDLGGVQIDGETVLYLSMEYVAGRTLSELLDDLGAVPEALLREVALQVAAGLVAIHAAGVVHRDLKPANVLITDDHQVRIMDLGVARLVEQTHALTQPGEFVGSLWYAAPEQFRDGVIGPAVDLYALGVMIHELATGANPFARDRAAEVIAAHLNDVPPRLNEVNPDVSPFLSEVAARLLAKVPASRFPSAAFVRAVLEAGEASPWWVQRESRVLETSVERPYIHVRRDTDLFGREEEMNALRNAWHEAAERGGGVFWLEGEAGIGKTRLVDALVREIDSKRAHVLYGAYSPSGGMGGVSDAIVARFGAAGLATALLPYVSATPSLVPAFAALVRHESPPTGTAPLDAAALHAVTCHLMRGLAAERPLLWIVDDLHFAEVESRQLVLSLARAVHGHRVLLVLAGQPRLADGELSHFSRLPSFRRMTVERLSPRQVMRLVRGALRNRRLADRLGGQIAYKSDGVPFFVLEMLQEMKNAELLRESADGTYEATGEIERIEVPTAVRDLIRGRLGDLSEEERAILDVAAVQGFDFDTDLIARVREMKRVVVLERLASLERRSRIVRSEGGRCRFDHHQVQELLYGDLMPELREEYHTLLAEAFAAREGIGEEPDEELSGDEALLLASHRLRGRQPRAAAPFVERALAHLLAVYRHESALELADLALGHRRLLSGERRERVLLEKAGTLDYLGRRAEQREALDEALRLADSGDDPARRAKVRRALGWHLIVTSATSEAEVVLTSAAELARDAGDRREEAVCAGYLASMCLREDRLDDAREHCRRQLAIAREHGYVKEEGAAHGNLGIVFKRLGRYEQAREHYERDLEIAREVGERRGQATTTVNLGMLLSSQGRREEAREHYESALATFREIGDRRGEAASTGSLGNLSESLGCYAEAIEYHELHGALSRETGSRLGEGVALINLGQLYRMLGDTDRARDVLSNARSIVSGLGRLADSYVLHHLGATEEQAGTGEAAERYYEEALAARRELGYAKGVATTLLRLGGLTHARRRLEEASALAAELDQADELVLARACLALLLNDDPALAMDALRTHGDRMSHHARVEAEFLAWRLTGARDHLERAHDGLELLREHAPQRYRDAMVANVPLHCEIMDEWLHLTA